MSFPVPLVPHAGVPIRGGPAGFDGPLGTRPRPGEPGIYERILPGDCGPEYFSKLWEDEFRADLKEDALGTSLDHFRKFGLGHARVGGRVNLSTSDPYTAKTDQNLAQELINAGHGKYFEHRLQTPHLDGGDDPLYAIKQYFDMDPDKKPEKHIKLVGGGLEHIHLMAGDLDELIRQERHHEKAMGWLHKEKKMPQHMNARLESGAHLPPEGYVTKIVVPQLLKGEQLGLDIRGTTVHKVTEKKARSLGWLVGDQILKVNGRIISNNLEFQEQMEHAVAVLRTTQRPLIFEVWRELPHSQGGTWAELQGHRFASPQSVVPLASERPTGGSAIAQEAQVAALEMENAELRARLSQGPPHGPPLTMPPMAGYGPGFAPPMTGHMSPPGSARRMPLSGPMHGPPDFGHGPPYFGPPSSARSLSMAAPMLGPPMSGHIPGPFGPGPAPGPPMSLPTHSVGPAMFLPPMSLPPGARFPETPGLQEF